MGVPGVFRDRTERVTEGGERYTITTTEVSVGDNEWDFVKEVWRDAYGEVSRENGPAITDHSNNDVKEWYYMNERHRIGGPAIEYDEYVLSMMPGEGLKNRYFIAGDEYTKEEYEFKLKEFSAMKFSDERKRRHRKNILRNAFNAWNIETDNPRNPTGRKRMIRRFESEFPDNPLQGDSWPYMMEILEPEEE